MQVVRQLVSGAIRDVGIPLTDVEAVAVRYRARDAADTTAAASTAYILDDDSLAEPTTHFPGEKAPDDICRPAGGKRNHDCARPRWISLRARDARYSRQSGSASGQMQKSSSGKFHDDAPR